MARPVRVRTSYTSDRSRLLRLEQAVEKDPRLTPEKRAEVTEQIRRLVTVFMDLDSVLPPLSESSAGAKPAGKRKRRRSSEASA